MNNRSTTRNNRGPAVENSGVTLTKAVQGSSEGALVNLLSSMSSNMYELERVICHLEDQVGVLREPNSDEISIAPKTVYDTLNPLNNRLQEVIDKIRRINDLYAEQVGDLTLR